MRDSLAVSGVIDRVMFNAQIDSGFITVTGEDRLDFVHGLVSADVRGLAEGSGTGALLLNHRGHALAQLTVVRLPGLLLLAVEDAMTEFVFSELDRHIIFDQVTLERPQAEWTQLTVQGPAQDIAADLDRLRAADSFAAAVVARRSLSGGHDLFFRAPYASLAPLIGELLSETADRQQLEQARVEAGVAAAALDAGEGVLPQEAGLEHLVSYRKGCYLGQEIMARIEARGNLRRGLRRIRLEGDAGTERDVLLDGRRVGRLGTVTAAAEGNASRAGLAVLRLDLPVDAELTVGEAKVTVTG